MDNLLQRGGEILIRNGEFFVIHDLRKRGLNISQIAEELGRDRKTVRKWLEKEIPESYERTLKGPLKLDPFKEYTLNRMQEGCTNAIVILEEIQEQGYTGGATTLRNFMRPYRGTLPERATERFETPPGRQAQVDWGHFKVEWQGKKKRLYAFIMVLCYSRMIYVEFTEDEKIDTLMGCHVRAMQYFGGITQTCLYDNMKTVVTGEDGEGNPIWNERFAQFATHHGFTVRRCQPYRARTKGKVENGVKYVRQNFWPRIREFTSLHDLNLRARAWMDTIANVRIHGTTHERPVDRWKEEGLKFFNRTPFESVERHARKVPADALVSYQTNRYSVPFRYVGETIEIQDDRNGMLRFHQGNRLVAEHPKTTGRYQVSINKKHFEGIRKASKHKVPQPIPRLVSNPTPEVTQRPLSVYEQFIDEEGAL